MRHSCRIAVQGTSSPTSLLHLGGSQRQSLELLRVRALLTERELEVAELREAQHFAAAGQVL